MYLKPLSFLVVWSDHLYFMMESFYRNERVRMVSIHGSSGVIKGFDDDENDENSFLWPLKTLNQPKTDGRFGREAVDMEG